ncbi:MAG: shikimate dehydrogenase [Rhodospirillales bacterium]
MTEQARLIRAGVMGWPVGHSLSPRLHGYWLERYGIAGRYDALPVTPDAFARTFRELPAAGYAGVNITVPHKEAALAAVDEADGVAKRIGAVNTVVVKSGGALWGTNTDAFGFLENLKAGAPAFDVRRGPAVVLGAGGAARAVVVALLDAGAPAIRLINRTAARAEALAADIAGPVQVAAWRARADVLGDAALLVNATTLGMQGQPPLDMTLDALPGSAVVTDIVYAPLETALLKSARAKGCTAVDGLGMLLHQARPGFEAWFGVAPEVTPELRAHVLAGTGG